MLDKRTRVLLVYPEIPSSFWDFKMAVRMLGLRASMPPLGLATVAAMFPEAHFELKRIVDMNIRKLLDCDIIWADIVVISAMLVQRESVEMVIKQAKRLGKTVVIGGPFATAYPDEALAMGADHLVLGEAEATLPAFLEDLINGNPQQAYDSRSLALADRIRIPLNKEGKPDITRSPIPRLDLLEMSAYSSMAAQNSRSCPHDCEFCDVVNLFGHMPRVKTPAQTIAEIEAIRLTGWCGSIFIVDDNFIGNRNAAKAFLLALIEWQRSHGFPFSFFTEAGMNLANDDMKDILDLMVQAGFEEVFVGIESTDPDVLASMGKRQNCGDLDKKVATIQRAGLNVSAGFIIGSDTDKPGTLRALFEFIQGCGIVIPMPGLLTALKGTRLYVRLKEAGRLREESSGSNTHRSTFNFRPLMDEGAVVREYIELLQKLFASKSYFDRCRTLRKRLGPGVKRASQVGWRGLLATIRVFFHYLVKKPDLEFAKFMLGTLFGSPREFPNAVSAAVKLVHFQTITDRLVEEYRASHDNV